MEHDEVARRAAARVADIAASTIDHLDDFSRRLQVEMAESIPELRGDPLILDLLYASVQSNVRTFFHAAQHGRELASVDAPRPAVEYARRLAQREISSNALLRAYRLGQRRGVDWVAGRLAAESDDRVSFEALLLLQDIAFDYIDRVSEQVVVEYEVERERWLTSRNTIRAATLRDVLSGRDVDVAASERALGYRLRQNHVGLVLWTDERLAATGPHERLEHRVHSIAQALGSETSPLFVAQDGSSGWGWVPVRADAGVDLSRLGRALGDTGGDVRVAMGAVRKGVAGFRVSHVEALRAHRVAVVAGARADGVTSYSAPGVRPAAVLAEDVPLARELVASMLGDLARDDEGVERLRETLAVFLQENQSYVATAAKVHLHKNTVKYRVDKAVELRGRPIEDDRFDLELALVACRWLGAAVLT